jgi:hypothetical protein
MQFELGRSLCGMKGMQTVERLRLAVESGVDIVIDASELEKVSNTVVMSLVCVICNRSIDGIDRLAFDLGTLGRSADHDLVVAQINDSGAIEILEKNCIIYLAGKPLSSEDGRHLLKVLSSATAKLRGSIRNCFRMRLVWSHRCKDQQKIKTIVEELVKESEVNQLTVLFGGNPYLRDRILARFRTVLFELISNATEHAYAKNRGVAVFYSSIRLAKDSRGSEGQYQQAHRVVNEEKIHLEEHAQWIEIFVVDEGCGLVSSLPEWIANTDDTKLRTALRKAVRLKNPLHSLASLLLQKPLSRFKRHDKDLTPTTGLMQIGQVLNKSRDQILIFSDGKAWVNYSNGQPSSKWRGTSGIGGTAVAAFLQPEETSFLDDAEWVGLDSPTRETLSTALTDPGGGGENVPGLFVIDHRGKHLTNPPELPQIMASRGTNETEIALVVRPDRSATKQDLGDTVSEAARMFQELSDKRRCTLVIAEMSPFMANVCKGIVLENRLAQNVAFDIVFLSEDWNVACYARDPFGPGRAKRRYDGDYALTFLNQCWATNQKIGARDIVTALRKCDTRQFWEGGDKTSLSNCFLRHEIEWSSGSGVSVNIDEYLDLTQALMDPTRYKACVRAFRRILNILGETEIVATDDLLDGIVFDAKRWSYLPHRQVTGSQQAEPEKRLLTGSICLTMGTTRRYKEQSNDAQHAIAYLMPHPQMVDLGDRAALFALEWSPPDDIGTSFEHTPKWARIPDSPYVAPGGKYYRSIVRYKRDPEIPEGEGFHYPRSPQQTYDDLVRDGLLRLGHWHYGERHEFLGICMMRVVDTAWLYRGALYRWLWAVFGKLFLQNDGGEALADVLVFPSHPVTDALVRNISRDRQGFHDRLPSWGMKAVKFMGSNSGVPLLASPIIEEDLKLRAKKSKNWSGAIIDDGVVTGRHMRELRDVLLDLGASEVYTIAIVDRTGVPSRDSGVERFVKRHYRFWRCDFPVLGGERDCVLCQAIARARHYLVRYEKAGFITALGQWIASWETADIIGAWHKAVEPVEFKDELKIKFGVRVWDSGMGETAEYLTVRNSVSWTACLVELQRMVLATTRLFEKAREVQRISSAAAIEAVCAQLLLFHDDLKIWDRKQRYSSLVDLMWEWPEADEYSALAGLCLCRAGEEVVVSLWEHIIKNRFGEKSLPNVNAVLAVAIVKDRAGGEVPEYGVGTIGWRNAVAIGSGVGLQKGMREFLNIFESTDLHHSARLFRRLTGVADEYTEYGTPELRVAGLKDSISDTRRLLDLVRNTRIGELLQEPSNTDEFKKVLIKIDVAVQRCSSVIENKDLDGQVSDSARNLSTHLYGPPSRGSLASFVDDALFFSVRAGEKYVGLLQPIINEVKELWPEYLRAMPESSRTKWASNNRERLREPFFQVKSDDAENRKYIYLDYCVRSCIRDTLLNVVHATGRLEGGVDMRCRITFVDPYLVLRLENVGASSGGGLKYSWSKSTLEQVGGFFRVNHSPVYGRFVVEIGLPSKAYFFSEKGHTNDTETISN